MTAPRVLIACEFSGVMRRAFQAAGCDAFSCDLLPAEDASPHHYQADALETIHNTGPWDAMIAHPTCTFLANSGSKHLYIGGKKENGRDPDRWRAMEGAARFYRDLRNAPIRCKAIENPVMHGHAIKATGRGNTQFVHPYHFGDPFFKLTGFELINLPPLKPVGELTPPKPGTPKHREWSKCHRAPPGPDRWKDRSRTYQGIANACAAQWSEHIGGTK